ncbi:MAG: Gfo/Idh/MocA family oxidoreductase [Spirochaetota bacterium]
MDKIRVGVIGVGHMGLYHVNVLSTLNNKIELAGVSDINEKTASAVGSKYNVPYYLDNEDLLKNVDAVCIAAPTYLHYEITMKAFNHNVHVLVEKPIAKELKEAETLVNTAKKKNLIFQVGHLERFRGTVRGVKKLIKNPYLIEAKRLQPRNNRITDVGVVLDLMIHDIDIIHMLIESEVEKISAFGKSVYTDHEDIAKVNLLFKNGCIVDLTTSRLSQEKIRSLNIYQEKADLLLNFFKDEISIRRKSQTGYEVAKEELKYHEKMSIENLYIHTDNPLKNEIVHFINCISGDEKPLVEGEWDLKTLSVALNVLDILNEINGKSHNKLNTVSMHKNKL